jgi:hypothetical protein
MVYHLKAGPGGTCNCDMGIGLRPAFLHLISLQAPSDHFRLTPSPRSEYSSKPAKRKDAAYHTRGSLPTTPQTQGLGQASSFFVSGSANMAR